MTKKKYQVFISSTFVDMKDMRQAAVEAVLLAGHIPAGMELFSAGDVSQLEVIKRWITESDVFMLVLGARYGSIESNSQLSYIELEYNHAQVLGKPLFALVLSDAAIQEKMKIHGETVVESENPDKYAEFRKKVLSKISRQVDDQKDLKLYVLESISNIEQNRNLAGWIRSNDSIDVRPIITEVANLQARNAELSGEVKRLQTLLGEEASLQNLAGLNDVVRVRMTYSTGYKSYVHNEVIDISWGNLFAAVAPKLLEHPNDHALRMYMEAELLRTKGITDVYKKDIEEQDFQTIKVHLEALNLVSIQYLETVQKGMALFWNITERGKKVMYELRTVKKA